MTKQLMFYDRVTPVSAQRHADWCIEGDINYGFAKNVNSVPLVAAEIPHAGREYTVVFTEAGDSIVPLAILGVSDTENLYITDEGGWDAKYIPAFVRRYPFVFSRSEDGNTFTLCIDESWDGCNQDGRGERLIDENGERSPYLTRLMGFLQDYERNAQQTSLHCSKLKELDLLEQKTATFTLPSGEKASLRGFMTVSREKLHALPAEKLHELAQTGELELIYAHLLSMNNLQLVAERRTQATAPSEPAIEEKTEEPDTKEKPAKARKATAKI
jgi:hypothetical protein